MTIEDVKNLLGKDVEGISDDQLQKEIEAAELLKNIYFNLKEKDK